jgi:hypothetical protein
MPPLMFGSQAIANLDIGVVLACRHHRSRALRPLLHAAIDHDVQMTLFDPP